MNNGYIRKSAVAAIAAGVVTMAAWKAPQASTYLAAASSTPAATAPAPVPPIVAATSYAPVVDRVMPAVVTIRVEKRASMVPTSQQIPEELRRFFGDQIPQFRGQRAPRVERGLGSGVVVSADGYILTNNHVVDGADTVKVELTDERVFTGKVVGTDPATDLAVVKIAVKGLSPVEFGDSDAAKVGDAVLAIGNPLNVGETVTAGIISAKGRETGGDRESYQDFLQTDAAINHGNSGGALVNTAGQLVGINSQILTPSDGKIGLGFAIPSNMAKHVMVQLIATGSVRRAKLGVTVQRLTPDLASSLGVPSTKGALITSVVEGGPAAKAGFRQGDVVTAYNGKPVSDNNQFRNSVAATTPGSRVSIDVLRNGRTETLQATVGELEAPSGSRTRPSLERNDSTGKFGMTVESDDEGVVITDLDPAGIAAESGLLPGDVIEKVDGRAVRSGTELKSALDRKDGKPSLLIVNRKGQTLFVTLRAE
jgi:serine protease Do